MLKIAQTKTELNKLEIELINKYNAIKSIHFYNLHEGGRGGDTFSGKHHTQKTKMMMSKRKKGKPSPHKGKSFRSLTNKEKKDRCLSSPKRIEIIVN